MSYNDHLQLSTLSLTDDAEWRIIEIKLSQMSRYRTANMRAEWAAAEAENTSGRGPHTAITVSDADN